MMILSIAGLKIGVHNRYRFEKLCRSYLAAPDEVPDFEVTVSEEEIEAERTERNEASDYLEFVCTYRKIAEQLPQFQAFVLHCAAVSAFENGYLFTAPSGTGKTTHMRLWLQMYPKDTWVINGDKPIIRLIDGTFYVCGTPWCGKENYGQPGMVPVRAICLLERGTENRIEAVTGDRLTHFFMHQIYLPKDPERLIRFLNLLDQFLRQIPAYALHCNMDPEAARLSFETMSKTTA